MDGTELLDGWTVNLNTGEVEFESATVGSLTVYCEYYTPVRFDTDEIEALQVSGGIDDLFRYVENPSNSLLLLRERVGNLEPIYQVNGLVLKEVHQPLSQSFYDTDDFNSITTDFSYPIVPENVRTNRYTTEITSGLSAVEDTVNRAERSIVRYASTGLFNEQVDYVLNYFFAAKGRALSFNAKRFDSDELSYTRLSSDYVTMSDVITISSPDSNNRRYQVFGKYLSKYTAEFNNPQNWPACGSTRYFRSVSPITLLPSESPADIVVRRNLTGSIGTTWMVAKKGQTLGEINVKDIGGAEGDITAAFTGGVGTEDYLHKQLTPENYIGGSCGISIGYRASGASCNQAICVKSTDTCRHAFCDLYMRLKIHADRLTGFTVTGIFDSQFATRTIQIDPDPPFVTWINSGTQQVGESLRNSYIEFTSGQLIGQKFDIKDTIKINSEPVKLRLWQSLPYGLAIGEELDIIRGCAKTPDACKAYSNFANFGGFPVGGNWMIGDDALLSGQ